MKIASRNAKGWVTLVAGFSVVSLGCADGTSSGRNGSGGSASGAGTGGAGIGAGTGGNTAAGGSGNPGSGGNGNGGNGVVVGQVGLPMVVTTNYNNQGWFGDASVMAYFTPGSTIIRQASSTAGPCATRQPGAVGQCLEIVYTPPPGLIPPAAGTGFIGVFFLTSLTMAHPELTPPGRVGDPNWGDEPGKNIAPGAARISFVAASTTPGLVVTFKEGTANDALVLPEVSETLTTSWAPYSMSFGGIGYGTSVAGAFAWILKDTTRAATFYLDGIVWE